jgi:SAM-dependent methyltransferase
VSFDVGADAYLRFMGRFSEPLAVPFADLAGLRAGRRVLDVGCGPGALTAELVRRQGAALVGAVDPSPSFAAAVRARRAARDLDPAAPDESGRAGVREGDLAGLFARAGLGPARSALLSVGARYASFDDWWEPFTLGVGPAGGYVAALPADGREALREHCRELLPDGAIEVTAAAWAAVRPP